MTDLDLEAIKDRSQAVTGDPYYWGYLAQELWAKGKVTYEEGGFIGHAHADVPALIEEVERLGGRLTITDDMVDAAIMGWARQTWTDAEGSWDEQGWTGAEEFIKNIHGRRFRAALEAALGEES